MDILSSALNDLKLRNDSSLESCLKKVLSALTSKDDVATSLVEGGILPELSYLLTNEKQYRVLAGEIVAEIAKSEAHRQPCVDNDLVHPLVDMLSSPSIEEVTQACRALGNISFDNDAGRDAIYQRDGMQKILSLMKSFESSTVEGADKLRMILCGCVLNFANDKDNIQQQARREGALEMLNGYLQTYTDDEDLCTMALLAAGVLTESDDGKEKVAEIGMPRTLVDLLSSEVGQEIDDAILELLISMSENDDVKLQLSQSQLKDLLLTTLKRTCHSQDVDCVQVTKLSSDLLVLLLTGDASMYLLYDGGNGVVFREALSWLHSDNAQLKMSAVLAVGNFARSDELCSKMVELGITGDLLSLLKEAQGQELGLTLQHAVLSALRNLAIPACNKAKLNSAGVFEAIVPLVTSDVSPIQFKLLGLLRMLIDGQGEAAKSLGSNSEVVARIIKYCSVEGHEGVKGEANRLVASILKNGNSTDVMRSMVDSGAVSPLVTMTTSEHVVMQNEALVALTLLGTVMLDYCEEAFQSADVVTTLNDILLSESTLSQILCNVMSLVQMLSKSGKLKEAFQAGRTVESLSRLCLHKEMDVQEQARKLLDSFSVD